MIRVVLPHHLCTLAGVAGDVRLDVVPPVTIGAVLDALESGYPMLRGTIRTHEGGRRPMVRFFVDRADVSLHPADTRLPAGVADGRLPFRVIAAIAGG